jgi:hypothetical protein
MSDEELKALRKQNAYLRYGALTLYKEQWLKLLDMHSTPRMAFT